MGCEGLRHPIEDGDDEAICCIAFGRLMNTEGLKSITNVDHRMLIDPCVDSRFHRHEVVFVTINREDLDLLHRST